MKKSHSSKTRNEWIHINLRITHEQSKVRNDNLTENNKEIET